MIRIEIGSLPFAVDVDGHKVEGRVGRADGAQRQNAVLDFQRAAAAASADLSPGARRALDRIAKAMGGSPEPSGESKPVAQMDDAEIEAAAQARADDRAAIEALGRSGGAIADVMIDVADRHLVEVSVVLTRDGEDWPLPEKGHPERRKWIGYLPIQILQAAYSTCIGTRAISETEAGN